MLTSMSLPSVASKIQWQKLHKYRVLVNLTLIHIIFKLICPLPLDMNLTIHEWRILICTSV